MSPAVFERFKAATATLHDLIARSGWLSRIYLHFWRLVLRRIPAGANWWHIYSSMFVTGWPIERLAPVTCPLIGSDRSLRFVPHPGMIDFQAFFSRELEYETEVVRFLEGHLAQVDNVVEIGANIGVYSLYFSSLFASRGHGHVFAFEPSPRTFRALLDNLLINQTNNVTPLNAAVFTHAGLAKFYEPTVALRGDRALTRSSLIEGHARYGATQVREYPVFTVDPAYLETLFKDRGRVLIKLDIEGAERHVLAALQPLLERYRPGIVMEALYVDCDSLNAIGFLAEIYRFFHLTGAGPVEHPRFIGDPSYRFKDYFLSPRTP